LTDILSSILTNSSGYKIIITACQAEICWLKQINKYSNMARFLLIIIFDGLDKSPYIVISAKAGIKNVLNLLDSG